MAELNTMLLEHARAGLQVQLEVATTNGDIDAVRKVTTELEKLAVSSAPKAPPYGHAEIQAELEKQDWFGVDPKKSARAVELGKSLSLKRFGTAAEFAAALVKAVDEEFKPAGSGGTGDAEDADAEDEETENENEPTGVARPKKPRASDGPGDGDAGAALARRKSGPWTKMSDAPSDVQKEINRTADKFAPKTKDGREKFVAKALEAQYNAAQTRKAKK